MLKGRLLIFLVFLLPSFLHAQEKSAFGIKISGYIKNDLSFDSRQTVAARQGHFLLFPKGEYLDEEGEDINASYNWHLLSIQTRLRANITAPDVLGAKTTGFIEGAFFGNIESDINGFRLRHAFIKLSWENTELLAGQYWHAMFITDCFPGTVSFNTGAPFQPFSRNPQLMLAHKMGKLRLALTAHSQIDFTDSGPDGAGTKYIRNAGIPEMNLKIEYRSKNNDNSFLAGAGVNYKTLKPRLMTNAGFKTSETLGNLSIMAYSRISLSALTIKMEGVYGQGMQSMTMIGGYAVKDITDMQKDFREYSPLNTLSLWADIHSNAKTWQPGLFLAYSENMGSKDELQSINYEESLMGQEYYARGADIKYLYRLSPRLIYNNGKFRLAGEIEYTAAAYGSPDENGKIEDADEVANFRFLIGTYLFF